MTSFQDARRRDKLLLTLAEKVMPVTTRPVSLVMQRGAHDCGQACVAMVLRKDIDYVDRHIGRTADRYIKEFDLHGGLISAEICRVLWEHRMAYHHWSTDVAFAKPNEDCGFHHSPWRHACRDQLYVSRLDTTVSDHVEAGGTAILGIHPEDSSVAWEHEDRGHWVVISGCQMFDPSGFAPMNWRAVERFVTDEAILVREFALVGP